ncbi:MAG: YciI family protein [Alteromonadaceae bacterium]|nr:YciI family protein [Alteromonadaceae bacterium]
MQYLMLIYDEEKAWDNFSEQYQGEVLDKYHQLGEYLQGEGILLGGERLQPTDTATSVRVRNGETLISDGPFAETKEQLGGFYMVECRDLDHANEVAAKIPSAEFGTIEVRPIWLMQDM